MMISKLIDFFNRAGGGGPSSPGSFTQKDETIQIVKTTVKILRYTFLDTHTCPQTYSFEKTSKS
jgi:hypothetical protein